MKGTLYLIPIEISDNKVNHVLPQYVCDSIHRLDAFIVENLRTARRFIRKTGADMDFDQTTFFELNKHTKEADINGFTTPLDQGKDMGLMSEAGVPCVADPGSRVVQLAHEKGIKVVPLVGPSSILLSLMGSGFNGQSFCFHGYIPVKPAERRKFIKKLEGDAVRLGQTQIFIEAPYRNEKLLDDILNVCISKSKLCIAKSLTGEDEFIQTKTMEAWKKARPNIQKFPTVFLLGGF